LKIVFEYNVRCTSAPITKFCSEKHYKTNLRLTFSALEQIRTIVSTYKLHNLVGQ